MRTEGEWWLPDTPERKVRGFLTHEGEWYRLTLEGSLNDAHPMFRDVQPAILGASERRLHTLADCFRKSTVPKRDPATNQLYVEKSVYETFTVIDGIHLRSPLKSLISEAVFENEALFYWLGLTGTSRSIEESDGPRHFTIEYMEPEPLIFDAGGVTIKLGIRLHEGIGFNPVLNNMKEVYSLQILPTEPQALDSVRSQIVYPVCRFVSFACGAFIEPRTLELRIRPDSERTGEGAKWCYLRPWPYESIFVSRKSHPETILIPEALMEAKGAHLIREWLRVNEEAPFIFSLWFSAAYRQNLTIEDQFLSLAQALESFHRWRFKRKHLPTTKWRLVSEELRKVIDGQVLDENIAQKLKDKLNFFNEATLAERLFELISYTGALDLRIVRDADRFVAVVKATRNYWTHYGKKSQDALVETVEIVPVTEQMRCLLELCVLLELGVTAMEVKECISGNERFRVVKEDYPGIL